MKKLTAITLAAVLALGVAACGGTGAGGNSATDDTQGKTPVDILNDVWADYEEEGYESEEDWQEAYYGDCGAIVEEITEAEYKEETKPVWPFELVRKEEI